MSTLIAQIGALLSQTSGRNARRDDVARNLMERAEAAAGQNPRRARELRRAARAYLSVIR
jgi:hypothetical protein